MTKEERERLARERLDAHKDFDVNIARNIEDFGKREIYLCGLDEVGRGCLAGDVYAAAVVMPLDSKILGVDDSKKLCEKKREAVFDNIMSECLAFGIGRVDSKKIDEINILNATKLAMREAIKQAQNSLQERMGHDIDVLLVDSVKLENLGIKSISTDKGDSLSYAIGAASILAKVSRDREMIRLGRLYPEYGFEKHKGYGTKQHYEAISKYGLLPFHRRSFLKGL